MRVEKWADLKAYKWVDVMAASLADYSAVERVAMKAALLVCVLAGKKVGIQDACSVAPLAALLAA